jgi:hypothetical protein
MAMIPFGLGNFPSNIYLVWSHYCGKKIGKTITPIWVPLRRILRQKYVPSDNPAPAWGSITNSRPGTLLSSKLRLSWPASSVPRISSEKPSGFYQSSNIPAFKMAKIYEWQQPPLRITMSICNLRNHLHHTSIFRQSVVHHFHGLHTG